MENDSRSTILVIEDEAPVRMSITAYLEDHGYKVIEAENGRIGLEVFRREAPDLILVDLRMPEVDGLEVLAIVVAESPDTPIIVVSGAGVIRDSVEALHLGAWDYVLKPIPDMNVMVHAVQKALERSRLLIDNKMHRERLEEQVKERTAELEREIEERRRAEAKLRESEEKYRNFLNNLGDVAYETDSKGNITYTNKKAEEFSGILLENIIGKPFLPFFTEESQKTAVEAYQRTLNGESAEYELTLNNGKIGHFKQEPLLDNNGNVIGVFGIARDIANRKKAEAALKASERSYREIFNASNEAIFVHDMETGAILDVNRTMCEMFGYTHEEAVNLSVGDLSQDEPPYTTDHARKWIRRAAEKGSQRFEWWAKRKNGGLLWAETNLKRAAIDGQDRILAFITDITERKQVEKALKEAYDIINRSPAIALLWKNDAGWPVEFVSDNVRDLFGYTADEFTSGQVLYDMTVHPDDLARVKEEVALYSKEEGAGGFVHAPYRIVTKDGKIKWINDRTRIRRDKKGIITHYEGIVEDITERRQMEEALIESEKRYRAVVEDMPAMICRFKQDGTLTFVNSAYCKYFNKNPQELIDHDFFQFIPEAQRNAVREHFIVLDQNMPMTTYEHQVIAPDGSTHWQEWTDRALFDEKGHVAEYQSIGRDITETKLAQREKAMIEKQLQQAQKMEAIGTLAGGIAHDFNNILGAIIGYTGMIEMFDVPEDSPITAKLKEVLKAAHRAKDLVAQILTFSRQTEQERKPVQLNYIIKETLKFLRASLPTTIEIRQHIANEEFIAMADPTQMHQVLMNLCTNGAHAMLETGGILEVTLSAMNLDARSAKRFVDLNPGPHLKLTVRDTGHGMTPEVMERIFDPFFTTKKRGEGTGMGLSLVHGILKSHGGVISLESRLGKGTTFQLILPRIEMAAIESRPNKIESLPTGTEQILFVDDENALVSVVQNVLSRLGYAVTSKTSSKEALDLFRNQPENFDLVITDQTMPHMTGIELALQMMDIRPDIPVILCTGYSEVATPDRLKAAGIRQLINKPLDISRLAETVRNVLDHAIDNNHR